MKRIFQFIGLVINFIRKELCEIIYVNPDRRYWSGIAGMTGAASLAVGFFDFNLIALFFGVTFCYLGYKIKYIRSYK